MAMFIQNVSKLPRTLFINKCPLPILPCRCRSREAIEGRAEVRKLRKQVKKEAREKAQNEKKAIKSLIPGTKMEYEMASLASRGFLRSTKPYSPPSDVKERILKFSGVLFKGANTTEQLEKMALDDSVLKYKLLVQCKKEFSHPVTNSQLQKMKTVGDVIEYYELPVKTTTAFDDLHSQDLPPNLYVLEDYVRFHPETDEKFGGISAFPESSTIVTGLKAKKLYRGHSAAKLASKMKL